MAESGGLAPQPSGGPSAFETVPARLSGSLSKKWRRTEISHPSGSHRPTRFQRAPAPRLVHPPWRRAEGLHPNGVSRPSGFKAAPAPRPVSSPKMVRSRGLSPPTCRLGGGCTISLCCERERLAGAEGLAPPLILVRSQGDYLLPTLPFGLGDRSSTCIHRFRRPRAWYSTHTEKIGARPPTCTGTDPPSRGG